MEKMAFRRASLIPFFLFSLGLHLLLFFSWTGYPTREESQDPIPVALLPSPEKNHAEPVQRTEKPRSRAFKAPVPVAKKSTPSPAEPVKEPIKIVEKEKNREVLAYDKREARDKNDIVRHPLPSWKELLPPVTWSRQDTETSRDDGPVSLNTREPKYLSYFASIKRAIELVWQYPAPALRQGLEGKLVLQFTILSDGALEGTRLVRSSGFSVLDEEAIRAVQTASPFHPIPSWVGKNRLDIIASFEYHDNRLKYGFMP